MLAKPFLRLLRCEVVHTVLDTIEGSTSRFNEKDYQWAKYQLCSLTEYTPGGGSLCHEKVLGEWPFLIDPLSLAEETCIVGNLKWFRATILVTALGPDGLAFAERDG